MSKLHQKPYAKRDKEYDNGFEEYWKLNSLNNLDLTFNTVFGRERITESKNDRLIIVLDGLATNLSTKEVIREGAVIEIPAGKSFYYQGQLKYYLITQK